MNKDRTCDEKRSELTQTRSAPVLGFTYFVRDGDFVKIGSSISPAIRIRSMQVGFPRPLETLAVVPDSVIGEMAAHQKFAHLRTTGEWFTAAPELLDFIETIKLPVIHEPPAVTSLRMHAADMRRLAQKLPRPAAKFAWNLSEQIDNFIKADSPAQKAALRVFMARSAERLEAAQAEMH